MSEPSVGVFVPPDHAFPPTTEAGESTCPICKRTWLVTPWSDCFMPACGCYGDDSSRANPARPCEPCGLSHMREHKAGAA